jgi:hypothetical protein
MNEASRAGFSAAGSGRTGWSWPGPPGQQHVRPAVGHQPEQERSGLPAWLDAPEPRSDPGERHVEMFLPLVYIRTTPDVDQLVREID